MSGPLVRGAEPQFPRYLQPPTPSVFTLEITRRCHHHCAGCGNVFSHKDQEMDEASWAAIIARLRPFIQALRITGVNPRSTPSLGTY